MRNELLSWFAREGLLLTDVSGSSADPDDEVKVSVRAPLIALSRASTDFRECLDPIDFGYPDSALDMMILTDMHEFVYSWYERAVAQGMARCFVCNRLLLPDGEDQPWDAVFISKDIICWLLVHFDCKRYLNRDLKGRHPFEVTASPPEFFDLRLS